MSKVTASDIFEELEDRGAFIRRHIGPNDSDISAMLKAIELNSLEELIDKTLPASIRQEQPMKIGNPNTEEQALAEIRDLAKKNIINKSFIGMGYYGTHVPAVIQRNVLENPGWYTAYTPYQPEISQGRLEALLNFQQVVLDLTAMELANASLLDEGTAAAEAMALCKRVNKRTKSSLFFIDENCHPQTIAVIKTRATGYGFDVAVANSNTLSEYDCFGALIQYPGSDGQLPNLKNFIDTAKNQNCLTVVAADLLSLTLLTPPGELGADVVVGNSQRFGVPMGFGGPHAAFFATADKHKRSMPGRVIGVSIDRQGRQALRMAMQTREQHIRREKATSNICTSQALLAIMAGFYAIYHGASGLKRIAQRTHLLTKTFALALKNQNIETNQQFFDTLTIDAGENAQDIIKNAELQGFNLRDANNSRIGVSFDETSTAQDVIALLKIITGADYNFSELVSDDDTLGIPKAYHRTSAFLEHPIFSKHQSETAMLRYMRHLEHKDIALNRSMIALGSCTMKLNASAEMLPISWPEFSQLHPFAPQHQAKGYLELFEQLEHMLCEATGYDAISLQPNAGSQGEYAGLLAILRYHESQGEAQRDICLIPHSAHGTNPASAVMAGMKVVLVNCDDNGNVDLDDLKTKAQQHSQQLAALMVTYPSTHGVYEEAITDICDVIHSHGGQVYLDGANLNALVGIAAPGKFGADVSHLNLHKTFCIPHGGGGPGMGPIGVGKHLAPFLPNNPVQRLKGLAADNDVISAAPWGSASILPISWMYIRMMGDVGLTRATKVAILSANYIAQRLHHHFPILYTGNNGFVAHECIIDIRPLKERTGITEEDIAKRLMDFGYHAPTMSFPVAGTLMIEPTESESLAELDRFIDALIKIREEIDWVEKGHFNAEDNPLKNAPHSCIDITSDDWQHKYSRTEAAYPLAYLKDDKYWPPVARIDNVYGDRNLFCACPSLESYEQ